MLLRRSIPAAIVDQLRNNLREVAISILNWRSSYDSVVPILPRDGDIIGPTPPWLSPTAGDEAQEILQLLHCTQHIKTSADEVLAALKDWPGLAGDRSEIPDSFRAAMNEVMKYSLKSQNGRIAIARDRQMDIIEKLEEELDDVHHQRGLALEDQEPVYKLKLDVQGCRRILDIELWRSFVEFDP